MNLRFHHACIETADYAATVDFYVRLLGFTVERETPRFHGRAYNSWLRSGDVRLEIQTPKGGSEAAAARIAGAAGAVANAASAAGAAAGPVAGDSAAVSVASAQGVTGLRHLCFVVEDLDASLRRLEAGGWTHFAEKGGRRIYEVEGGRLLKAIAPEGTVIELREGEGI